MKHTMQKWLRASFFFIAILCTARGQMQSAPAAEGAQEFANFGDFRLQNGSVIHDFRLGYRTLGKLNADKSNAILFPTWLGGKSEALLQFAGSRPSSFLDTKKYFVVLIDAIGDGVSTSPS